jgi:hypothetical protein
MLNVTRLIARCAAALALSGLAAAPPQSRTGGSEVPCAVPLTWRLARVDRDFGLDEARATAALRQAAAMWEERAGRALFREDPANGFPIRLVYDERQARTDERAGREAELRDERARLDAAGEELKRRGDAHAAARATYSERQREYDRRLEAYNAEVRRWNEAGGGPQEVATRLDSVGRALRADREAIESERRPLERDLEGLQREVDRVNRANADHARRADAFARDSPAATVQAGEYREAITMEGRRVVSVSREIRVYRFADAEELRLIVAHELGHALGLGHSDEPAAVMSAAHDSGAAAAGGAVVHAADLGLLRATCPGLGVSAR